MLSNSYKLVSLMMRYLKQALIHTRLRQTGIQLSSSSMILGKCRFLGKQIEIGKDTLIRDSSLDGRGGLQIGNEVCLVQTTIITSQHDLNSPVFETVFGSVIIEDYAVLFTDSMVLPGIRISRGAIVAARAVVTHDVPSMAIVAGNPAKIIGYRSCIHTDLDMRRLGGFAPSRLTTLIRKWWL